jgi:hypothetical protein
MSGTNLLGVENMNAMWAGMVMQDNGSEYPMSVVMKEDEFEVDYPTLGCGGVLKLISVSGGTFRCLEQIERGLGQCAQGVEVVLRATMARQMEAEFYLNSRLVARGSLVRSPQFP